MKNLFKKGFPKEWIFPVAALLVLILVLAFSSPLKNWWKQVSVYLDNVSNDEISKSNFWLPSGSATYQISQAEGKNPKIHEATIDPPDVHLNEIQKLSIVVSDHEGIQSVVAKIQTDHAVRDLPLSLVKEVSKSELIPPKVSIAPDGRVTVLKNNPFRNFLAWVSPVEAHEVPKLLYEASWKVVDTHSAKYHTTFVVKNVNGDENSITLAWSDPCIIPNSGSWNINTYGNCTISSVNGIDAGNVTIATYTLTLNSTFAFNAGNSMSITTGAIAIGAGGQIRQTYLWRKDGDGDLYPSSAGADQVAQDTDPDGGATQWQRKSVFTSGANLTDDCYDSNGEAYPGQTAFFGVDRGDASFDYDCSDGIDYSPGLETFSCGAAPPNCNQGPGWQGGPPVDCGFSGTYYNSCNNAGSICNPGSVGASTLLCR